MAEGDTVVNAFVGGIAAIVFSFVPLSPVLGGAVAGYLQGGTRSDGLRVGALAGVVAAIPLAVAFFGLLVFASAVTVGVPLVGVPLDPRVGGGVAVFLLLAVFALVVAGLYTVGLGALGGWLGNYVKYETDVGE